jgi:hypothetical protein
MLRCRVLGHRFRFRSEGVTMLLECERGCGAGSVKQYPSADRARRYATAFDQEYGSDVGNAPLFGLFPLRLLQLGRRLGRRRNPPR